MATMAYPGYRCAPVGVGMDVWAFKKAMDPLVAEVKAYVAKHPNATWQNDPKLAELKRRFDELNKQAPHDAFGDALRSGIKDTVGAIQKIPVLGPVISAAAAPLSMAASISRGERIDHALLDAAKAQLNGIKAIGPYVATVISFIPGIGTGVAAALAAGIALAEGKSIDQALEDAIKSAIPGGALAVTGFDLAKKVASGQNVAKSVLEAARSQLPPAAQKAFDVGLAVVEGKRLQNAIASAVVSLAPGELKQILDVGAKAVQSVPGLATLAKSLPTDIARQGLQLASGALAHAGVNETQIRAIRSKLTGDILHGFDSALKAQAAHFPWIDSVVAQAPVPIAAATPEPTQAQLDLQALSKLSPEQQKQLVDMQALSKLTPEQQKQLIDYANAKKAADAEAATPKPTPKPGEPPKRAAATPKPLEPPTKKPTRAGSPVAPASPSTPAPAGGLVYGPYPSGAPGGALRGALAGYGAYPGVLSVPPHPHLPHGPHGGGHPHARPIQDGRTWGWRGPWWGVPFVPEAPTSTLEACRVWGNAIDLPPAMERAARAALGASRGNPTTVRGPDGALYLFAFENGRLSARPCAAVGT